MTAETPPERFARRQAERDAEKARERERIRQKAAHEPIHPKHERRTPPPVKAPRRACGSHSAEYARITADLVQRHGVVETARLLGENKRSISYRLRKHGLKECHPVLHAEDYAKRHGLRTWRRGDSGGLATWERVP